MNARTGLVTLRLSTCRRCAVLVLSLLAVFAAAFSGIARADTPLIPKGAVWRYLDTGSDQGTAWRNPSFSDSNWRSGPAQLGYGDGDEATVVRYGKASNKYITTYFRHAFNVHDPAGFESLNLWMQRDDGAVVYINGVEVLRSNMPTGSVGYTTRATAAVDGADEIVSASIPATTLLAGSNVIAVEIHQVNPTSSDIGLDLSLDAVVGIPSTVVVPAGSSWKYLDNGTEQGTAWRSVEFDDNSWAVGAAELGYGDGGERTVVNSGPSTNKFITTYFRGTFDVADPTLYAALKLRLMRDDGAVVYLNGTEVHRANLPSGEIDSTTLALGAVGGADESTFFPSFLPNLLVAGTNVLAVEIHQNEGTSSDVSFDLELLGLSEAPEVSITRGPYLQNATSRSMVIRWRTDVATTSKVWIGQTAETLAETEEITTPTTEHEVEITGLLPDQQYFYAVGSGTVQFAGGADHSFYTPPVPGTRQPIRIWVLGDSGTANQNAEAVRDAYLGFNGERYTDMWLMLGDNAYNDGTDAQFQAAVFDMYPSFLRQSPLWSTLGNHEYHTAQATPYFDLHTFPTEGEAGGVPSGTEKYYSFDYGNVHFICLDSMSSDRSSTGPMAAWLREDLESTTQDWIIAFFHHPPYTKGSHNSDNPTGSDRELLEMREGILPILEAGGVDLVLGGHSHSYERSYLIDGHYGLSSTFMDSMKKAPGDGREVNGVGGYSKPFGLSANQGSVFAVAGSSGKATNWWGGSTALVNPAPHPAMVVSLLKLGSLVLDVDGSRLDVTFLNSTGGVDDRFTIKKEIPNTPPTITINSPLNDTVVNAPVTITATATPGPESEGGTVTQVDFYVDGQVIGTATQPSAGATTFEMVWENATEGSHTISATAWDDRGASTSSAPVTIQVNEPPIVFLTSPLQNASYEASETVTISATVTDSETIEQVSFYANGSLIATVTESPYEVQWNDMATGQYSLTATALDASGGSSTSAPITVTITPPNMPPTVQLTNPAANATFAAQSTITLGATASDDGVIARVEFHANGTFVGSAESAPYTFSWANVAPGQYAITATAVDDREIRTTSGAVSITVNPNVLPAITLTSPVADAIYTAPAAVHFGAEASDADGGVAKVVFYAQPEGGNAFAVGEGILNADLWEFTWDSASEGIYTLSAVVTDTQGGVTASAQNVTITVNPPPNVAPVVAITSPVADSTYATAADVAITADASDNDGLVAKVEFFISSAMVPQTLIGTATAAPYSIVWRANEPGEYQVTAIATDDEGATGNAAAVTFTVMPPNLPPSVEITGPAAGSTFEEFSTIRLSANAADSDGVVAKIEFYANGALIGTSAAAPYLIDWLNVSAGSYAITAVAIDDKDGRTTSEPIEITVNPNALPSVTLTIPANSEFIAPASIVLTAEASDSDGTIQSVAFYNGDQLLHTDESAPFTHDWNNVPAGVYSVTAVATDDKGARATSPAVAITVAPNPLPAAPSDLVANVSKNRVDLTWADNASNEEGYTVERRKEAETQWQTIGTVAADVRTFSDKEFARRTNYVYRVRAFNASGTSEYSPVANATTMR